MRQLNQQSGGQARIAYHGETGFLRFTQQKPVLVQSRFSMGHLFYPPYGPRFDQIMGLLKRWL